MNILTYCIVCLILFVECQEKENDCKLRILLKYILGGVCLICLTLLSII